MPDSLKIQKSIITLKTVYIYIYILNGCSFKKNNCGILDALKYMGDNYAL